MVGVAAGVQDLQGDFAAPEKWARANFALNMTMSVVLALVLGTAAVSGFWFRDAAFIVHALLCAGLTARAERALQQFANKRWANIPHLGDERVRKTIDHSEANGSSIAAV